nr:MAG TPA: hypothetical protein [Bacteriophage sp.]DAX13446.1 MAG TPA: hypothetical protein [Bacteriophage sp.]
MARAWVQLQIQSWLLNANSNCLQWRVASAALLFL